ncbi:MAG TPA: hypothetical protein VM425_09310 [Myxococcota bacterium]|nr:hypothetical protein [Myxococcota bacterium]
MAVKKSSEYRCDLVNETVKIILRKKSTAGLRSTDEFFVQCDQDECQYVGENKPPCPLDLSLYEAEIEEREEMARLRREESRY